MTAKYHSEEMEDTLHEISTAIPRIAERKFMDFPWNLSDFVKFLVTCTVVDYI